MPDAAQHDVEPIGESCSGSDRTHNLFYELSHHLRRLGRYDQYIANAEWRGSLRLFWEELKSKEQDNVRHLQEQLGIQT